MQIFPLRENTLRHVVEGDGRYPRAMTPSGIGKYVGVFLIFARKDSLFALGDIVSFVTHFVEGKSERTLIEGRRCSMDVRSSFSLRCTILKGLH